MISILPLQIDMFMHPSIKYRPDIDGLRALAISLVLIYHAGFSWFPSGFVGVDIFFVISGFLITSILHNSLKDNQFSFLDFYKGRLWRLQPALICFVLTSFIITLLFFLPEDLLQFSRSSRKTLLFISNSFFRQTTTGYFAPEVTQLPLLHTWSLSIEWQCYLFLPWIMYGIYKLFDLKKIPYVIASLTLVGMIITLHHSKAWPAETYYQLSSRIFEFLIGSCVSFISLKPRINSYLLNGLGIAAFLFILYIAHMPSILLGYPNEYAIAVCVATAIIIGMGGVYPDKLITKILSFRPIVFIGLLSYSLYLWHWLILAVLRYQNIQETSFTLVLALGATFIIAYCSWRFIEKPARYFRQMRLQYTILNLLILPILVVYLMDQLLILNSGFPQRFNKELIRVYQQLEHYNSRERPQCINAKAITDKACVIGEQEHYSKKGLLIGDSFSNHYWGFISTFAKEAKLNISVSGTSSCLTLPNIYLYDWWHFKKQVYQECYDQTQKYYQMIQNNHYDYVLIGQIWANYLSPSIINRLEDKRSIALAKQRLEQALDQALKLIVGVNSVPVLIKSTAAMQAYSKDCFFKHIKLRQAYDAKQCTFSLVLSEEEQWFDRLFDRMKIKYPNLLIIDPKEVQCANNLCSADIKGVPVFRDVGHLTDYASYQFGMEYLKRFGNPFLKSS